MLVRDIAQNEPFPDLHIGQFLLYFLGATEEYAPRLPGGLRVRAAEESIDGRDAAQPLHIDHRQRGGIRIPHGDEALAHQHAVGLLLRKPAQSGEGRAPYLQNGVKRALHVAENLLLAVPRHAAGRAAVRFQTNGGAVAADEFRAEGVHPCFRPGGFAHARIAGKADRAGAVLHARGMEGDDGFMNEAAFEGGANQKAKVCIQLRVLIRI